jgi:hypothetical protein
MARLHTDRGIYLLDGHNLAMAQGTGIATYARGMAEAVAGQGFLPGVIGGADFGRPASSGRIGAGWRLARRMAAQAGVMLRGGILNMRAVPATLPGLPAATLGFDAPDCVGLAHFHLRRHGQLLPLRPPPGLTPRVMHWTFPTPLRLQGVPNL